MTWQAIATAATTATALFNTDNLCCEIPLETPKKYLTFNIDVLALAIAKLDEGKMPIDVVNELHEIQTGTVMTTEVTDTHQELANKIYSYFGKKHTMRRLKNEYISPWMHIVDEICEDRKRIEEKSLPVLVTLPKFYAENLELEPLMRECNSAPDKFNNFQFDETITFIKKINRRASKGNYDDYYWKTKNNYLVRVRVESHNVGTCAWDFVSKQGTIGLKSEYVGVKRIQGYEFNTLVVNSLSEVFPTN